jgi:ketosteroid isomerase-like protein
MSSIEDNKAICRKFHVNIMEGKFDDAAALLADDVVWWVQGNMVVSGFHRGRHAVTQLFEPLKALPHGISFEFGAVTAEADRVSVEMVAHAKLGEGREYNNTYHFLFRVRDGLIVQGKEYLDTKLTHETLFASV